MMGTILAVAAGYVATRLIAAVFGLDDAIDDLADTIHSLAPFLEYGHIRREVTLG